jgi:hypothetical protein
MLTELYRLSLQRNILMFICESTNNRALIPEDIICLLWRRSLLLFQERPILILELIVTLLYTFKVVAYVVLAIFIHPICHSIMFSSFQKVKQAGIWIFPCSSRMVVSITQKRSLKYSGMFIDFMCTLKIWNLPIYSREGGCSNSWSVMFGYPLISATSLGLPTIKQDLEQISIKGYVIVWAKMVCRIWVKLVESFCHPLIREELTICNSCFKTPWLFVVNTESPISLSP